MFIYKQILKYGMPYKNIDDRKAYDKWYRDNNKEKRAKANKEWRLNNKDKTAIYNKKWSIKRILRGRTYRSYSRDKLFEILGGKICVSCGFDNVYALHFDHINDDGKDDRKKHGNNSNLYRYYIKNPEECKQNLQVLCANCNWIKKHKAQIRKNNEFLEKHPNHFKEMK